MIQFLASATRLSAEPGMPLAFGRVEYHQPEPDRVVCGNARHLRHLSQQGLWQLTSLGAGSSHVAFLCNFFAGAEHHILLEFQPGAASTYRLEVHGYATRMQKAVAIISRTGEIVQKGEELGHLEVELLPDRTLRVKVGFIPYHTCRQWLYLMTGEPAEKANVIMLAWRQFGVQVYRKENGHNISGHYRAYEKNNITLACQNYLVLHNTLQTDFEFHKPGAVLSELWLETNVPIAHASWWTSAPIRRAIRRSRPTPPGTQLTPKIPKYPIRSPALMDVFGPEYSHHGHRLIMVFDDFTDLRDETPARLRECSNIRLHAVYMDNSRATFQLPAKDHVETGYRSIWLDLLQKYLGEYASANTGRTFLEVGGRGADSSNTRSIVDKQWEYKSLDYASGPNVDIVGDAHTLATQFPPESWDVVYSSMVMEHLLQPWKFVLEANAILKQGGLFFALTPWACPLHAQPWDFFRPSMFAWRSLLNEATGFELLDCFEVDSGIIIPQMPFLKEQLVSHYNYSPVGTGAVARKIGPAKTNWNGYSRHMADGDYYPVGRHA